jgi:protein transport protein SEC61 subunit gamma and related proteins
MKSLNEYWVQFKTFLKECRRVLQVTKKPDLEEYKAIVKVTGLGMLLIGLLGFIIIIGGTLIGI